MALVLNNINSPENVLAITFLEELPGNWGYGKRILSEESASIILEPYRSEIEAERGKPLLYNMDLVEWLGDKYVQSLAEIHSYIRQLTGDRLLLYWQITGILTQDVDSDGYPYFYREIIQKGQLADGLMLYPLNALNWQRQLDLAINNNWYFFSQLSHPSLMRQLDWESALSLVKVKQPNNLGYFFYCGGNCKRPHRYDDPTILELDNISGVSKPVHLRLFAYQEGVGMDIIERELKFKPLVDINLKGRDQGDLIDLYAVISNPKPDGYYEKNLGNENEVWAKLNIPRGLELVEGYSPKVRVGDLASNRQLGPSYNSLGIVHWKLQVRENLVLGGENELSVFACSKDSNFQHSVSINSIGDFSLPFLEPQNIMVSGQGWTEPGFRFATDIRPVIRIETFAQAVYKPSLTNGEYEFAVDIGTWENNSNFFKLVPTAQLTPWSERIIFNDVLPPFSLLEIYTDNSALLVKKPIASSIFEDPQDPTGYQAFSTGYLVKSVSVNRTLEPNSKLRVSISGKASGGANSLLVLRFKDNVSGEILDRSVLVSKFDETWQEECFEIVIPPFANSTLATVYLYRYHTQGTIWYGSLSITEDPQPATEDVSIALIGQIPKIYKDKLNIITYFDEDEVQPSGDSKALIRLIKP